MEQKRKRPARYLHWYCAECQKKLEDLKYSIIAENEPEQWHSCALCGFYGQLVPVTMVKLQKQYPRRSGGGERARAGRG